MIKKLLIRLCFMVLRWLGVRIEFAQQGKSATSRAPSKCYTRTFTAPDGASVTKHTICDGIPLQELNTEYGLKLLGVPKLKETRDGVHFL